MKTQEWKFKEENQKHWLPESKGRTGPWDDEPDKRQWMSETGFPCLIVRNYFGSLCGYVGVSKGHPWYRKDYDLVDSELQGDDEDDTVHGGLTFAGSCNEKDPERGICHFVELGEDPDVWWLGFDCGHAFDLSPGLSYMPEDATYRDIAYVTAECEKLAELAKVRKVRGGCELLMSEDRVGYFQHVVHGRKFYPCDPRPDEVFIEDIAHALSNQCRFNGHTDCFYSVAEHCWHCSKIVPEEDALEALLHDAAEAYLGDLIRPLKMLPDLGNAYIKLEKNVEAVIAERFHLRYPWPESVKRADEAVITAEMAQIIEASFKGNLHDASVMADISIQCWSPMEARTMFRMRFEVLMLNR